MSYFCGTDKEVTSNEVKDPGIDFTAISVKCPKTTDTTLLPLDAPPASLNGEQIKNEDEEDEHSVEQLLALLLQAEKDTCYRIRLLQSALRSRGYSNWEIRKQSRSQCTTERLMRPIYEEASTTTVLEECGTQWPSKSASPNIPGSLSSSLGEEKRKIAQEVVQVTSEVGAPEEIWLPVEWRVTSSSRGTSDDSADDNSGLDVASRENSDGLQPMLLPGGGLTSTAREHYKTLSRRVTRSLTSACCTSASLPTGVHRDGEENDRTTVREVPLAVVASEKFSSLPFETIEDPLPTAGSFMDSSFLAMLRPSTENPSPEEPLSQGERSPPLPADADSSFHTDSTKLGTPQRSLSPVSLTSSQEVQRMVLEMNRVVEKECERRMHKRCRKETREAKQKLSLPYGSEALTMPLEVDAPGGGRQRKGEQTLAWEPPRPLSAEEMLALLRAEKNAQEKAVMDRRKALQEKRRKLSTRLQRKCPGANEGGRVEGQACTNKEPSRVNDGTEDKKGSPTSGSTPYLFPPKLKCFIRSRQRRLARFEESERIRSQMKAMGISSDQDIEGRENTPPCFWDLNDFQLPKEDQDFT